MHPKIMPTDREAIVRLARDAQRQYVDAHGVWPKWGWASRELFEELFEELTRGEMEMPECPAAVVAGLVLYLNPKLNGVTIVTMAEREGTIQGTFDGKPPF